MNYFILPGNPPALHFYELWGREIRERDPSAKTQVARYPFLEETSDSQAYFRSVVAEMVKQFREFRRREGGVVTLVGHSLGAYIALKVLAELGDEAVAAFLLHPFLRQPTLRGRALLKLAYELRNVTSLEKWLTRAQPLVGLFFKDALKLTPEEIRLFAQLAFHEHLTIAQDTTPAEIDPVLREKLIVYSTPGDTWCPPSTVAALGNGLRHTVGPAPHDFIVTRRGRDLIHEHLLSQARRPTTK